jgi:hypothetical protein
MTPENNSPNTDPGSESPAKTPVVGSPIVNEPAEDALKAAVELHANGAASPLKKMTGYSHGGIND